LICELAERGIQTILSHPERHEHCIRYPKEILTLVREGVILQITAGSLLGDFGSMAEKAGWYFLEMDPHVIIASDSHDIAFRRPRLSDSKKAVQMRFGQDTAQNIFLKNPQFIFSGQNDIGGRNATGD
jgi:protein-tyrosine phosphatase